MLEPLNGVPPRARWKWLICRFEDVFWLLFWLFYVDFFFHRFFSRNLKPVPDHKTRRCVEFVPQVSFLKSNMHAPYIVFIYIRSESWVTHIKRSGHINSVFGLEKSNLKSASSPSVRHSHLPEHEMKFFHWVFAAPWRGHTHVCNMRWQTTRKTLTSILITIFVYGNRQSLPIIFTNGRDVCFPFSL